MAFCSRWARPVTYQGQAIRSSTLWIPEMSKRLPSSNAMCTRIRALTSSSSPRHLPSAIRKLCSKGGEALLPQFVNGRWRGAAITARVAARIRKTALIENTFGSFDRETGKGWDPAWDIPRKIQRIRPNKETKRARTREMRAQKIESLVETMDEKIDDYRKDKIEKRPVMGIENVIKLMMRGGAKK